VRKGKSSGPDNLAQEVDLKRCDFDYAILYFAKKLLTDNMKPKQSARSINNHSHFSFEKANRGGKGTE